MSYTDPRGPERTIVSAVMGRVPKEIGTGDAWHLTLDCGHVSYGASHSWYEKGKQYRCLTCRTTPTREEGVEYDR